jgi:NADH-quinone oxidoreductase subunit M
MSADALIILTFILPLAGSVVLALWGKDGKTSGPVAAGLAAFAALLALVLVPVTGGKVVETTAKWIPSLGIDFTFRADGLSVFTLAAITGLTALAVIYAAGHMRKDTPGSFYAWLLLFMAGMTGVVLSADTVQFYLFWEAMLIPSAALIAFFGDEARRARTALKYFIFTHIGAFALFVGIAWTYAATGETNVVKLGAMLAGGAVPVPAMTAMAALFFTGFAFKLAIFPVHSWIPDAYRDAPAAAAVVMAGAQMGVGIYGLLRLFATLFPREALAPLAPILMGLALVTLYYGGAMALVERDIRRIVAYSSMSQMGYVLFGVGSLAALGVTGSTLHLLNHGMAKALLFMVIGVVVANTGITDITRAGGLARAMPITALAAVTAALALAGAPPLSGFHSEWLIFAGGAEAGLGWAAAAIIGSMLTAWYALWLVKKVFFGPMPEGLVPPKDAPAAVIAPMVLIGVVILVLGLFPGSVITWIRDFINLALAGI